MVDTLRQLAQIPDLAAEAYVTWNRPNPTPRQEGGNRSTGSKAPTDLAVLDALRPDPDAQGKSCRGLLMQAVWAVRPETGLDMPEQTFTGLCGWLVQTEGVWAGLDHHARRRDCWCHGLDTVSGTVVHTVAQVHAELAGLCRVQPAPVWTCRTDGCPERVHAEPGGYRCGAGHVQDVTGPLRELGRVKTATIADLSGMLGVPVPTLHRWRKAGVLVQVGAGRPAMFDIEQATEVAGKVRAA